MGGLFSRGQAENQLREGTHICAVMEKEPKKAIRSFQHHGILLGTGQMVLDRAREFKIDLKQLLASPGATLSADAFVRKNLGVGVTIEMDGSSLHLGTLQKFRDDHGELRWIPHTTDLSVVYERAFALLNEAVSGAFNLLTNNCEHNAMYIVTGTARSLQVEEVSTAVLVVSATVVIAAILIAAAAKR